MANTASISGCQEGLYVHSCPSCPDTKHCKSDLVMLPKPTRENSIFVHKIQANGALCRRETHWLEQGAQACEQDLFRAQGVSPSGQDRLIVIKSSGRNGTLSGEGSRQLGPKGHLTCPGS